MDGSDLSNDVNDAGGETSEHNTIMRKYSVKNTLYHKTSPVIVTYVDGVAILSLDFDKTIC